MEVGLYFGTFDPVHNGHINIAKFFVKNSGLDEVWCVVTPQNPFKSNGEISDDYERLNMVSLAVKNLPNVIACDIEFKLKKPNYTINTLKLLKNKYPKTNFTLIVGEDNIHSIEKWKNGIDIINNYKIYVYPRTITYPKTKFKARNQIMLINAPKLDISSSEVRTFLKSGENVRSMLPESVWKYISEKKIYK